MPRSLPMLVRFSLYGFLKNQRYFEPFLVLAFLEKGLSFFAIGLLVAFREVMVNLWEIPSGAVADVWGRRGSMIASFVAYITSFLLFGGAEDLGWLYLAMFFFAIGDAFRTGTHKAMIFQWLRLEGRTEERTKVYGFTRSWSKIGSAVSVLLAALFVLWSGSYSKIFYFAVIPYLLNIVNFLGYPKALEGSAGSGRSPREIVGHLRAALQATFARRGPRRLVLEAMGYEGVFHAVKDYLQPMVQTLVLASWGMVVTASWSETQQTALLIGPVYFVLYLLSAVASRQAHRVAEVAGGEDRAARWLWAATCALFLVVTVSAWREQQLLLVASFVLLFALQNFWRPILISRFDTHGDPVQGATVLSIESQSRRVVTMLSAPLLGLAVDLVAQHGPGGPFWPVGLLGLATCTLFLATAPRSSS